MQPTPMPAARTSSREPIVAIEDLHVDYPSFGGTFAALRGIDLTILPGEVVALVGESGAGKTTLARAIMRLVAAPDSDSRLHVDGCLALGPNLSIETCFLTSALATLRDRDDTALLAILRTVSGNAGSLDEFVNLCNYAVTVVPTFRNDVGPLRAFGSAISTPFETEKLTPFAEWYRAGAAKGCQLRCVFEDTPMFRELVRELQLRNLDDALLGPNYRPQQVTDDLASFWANTYPQVRKELRARYPKHAWPEDPLAAPPERRPRRK